MFKMVFSHLDIGLARAVRRLSVNVSQAAGVSGASPCLEVVDAPSYDESVSAI